MEVSKGVEEVAAMVTDVSTNWPEVAVKSGQVTLVAEEVSREKMMVENATVPPSPEGAMLKMEEAKVMAETVFVRDALLPVTVKERVKEVETVSAG